MAVAQSSYLFIYLSLFLMNDKKSSTFASPVNQPPALNHLENLTVIAGKLFRYIIPEDSFTDPEGGNLTYSVYDDQNKPLGKNSWIQFKPETREIYGLPLEEHLSRWNFIVKAQDSEGNSATSSLAITVQQNPGRRSLNHQFRVILKVLKDFNKAIDWQIRVLQGIEDLFGAADQKITVLGLRSGILGATRIEDTIEFAWTNDNVPKDVPDCPLDDIERLFSILESTKIPHGPSAGLSGVMSPEFEVEDVTWRGVGPCSLIRIRMGTYPPIVRNHLERLTATVGQIFIYKVPEDTFFDPEDGNTRDLELSLQHIDGTPISAQNWLQFNEKDQEFRGQPAASDEGSFNYQLVAKNSNKRRVFDNFTVEVVNSPTTPTAV